jgi:small-conductance mechanosensitive channel
MILQRNSIKKRLLTLWSVLITGTSLHALHIEELLRHSKPSESASILPAKEKKSQLILKNREKFLRQLEDANATLKELNQNLIILKQRCANPSEKKRCEFLNSLVSIMTQQQSTLHEEMSALQNIISQTDRRLSLLQEQESTEQYPRFTDTIGSYSYEGIKEISQQLVELQASLTEEEKNRTATTDELVKRKKAQSLAKEEYEAKKQELEGVASGSFTKSSEQQGRPLEQKIELMKAQELLARLRYEFTTTKVQEAEQRLNWIEFLITGLENRLTDVRKEFTRMKRGVRVASEYITEMRKTLDQRQQDLSNEREKINENLRIITDMETQLQHKIHESQDLFSLTPADISTIRSFTKDIHSREDWRSFVELANLILDESLIHIERDVLSAKIELEKAQFKKDEIDVKIAQSWHRMTTREARFRTDEEVDQEIKSYKVIKSELEGQAASLLNARETANNSLQQFNLKLDKLHTMRDELNRQRNTIFASNQQIYTEIVDRMNQLDEKIRRYFHWIGSLMNVYSVDITAVSHSLRMIESVIRELESKSFWARSELSINWDDLKNFAPAMRNFLQDLGQSTKKFFVSERFNHTIHAFNGLLQHPLQLLLFLINIILCITVFFLLKAYLPELISFVSGVGQGYAFIHGACVALAALLTFMYQYLKSIYTWIVCFALINLKIISDPYIAQVFYIITIPYGLWLVYRMVQYWVSVNREKKYVLVSEAYQRRFFGIISMMASVLVILSCLRAAYLAGGYRHATVPTILFAAMFILGQISAIGLIGRAQILGLLRSDTPMWQWIYEHVRHYYYIVLLAVIGIIIMCNPYVGYGRQVLYVIVRLALTLILIPLLSWIHSNAKHASIDLFFYYADRDIVKERFVTSRIWYGFFVAASLVIFLTAGVYIVARIWNHPLTLHEMFGWMKLPLYENESGIPINTLSLLRIVFYFMIGVLVAYSINTFIIARILDPFIVEAGVQNTIMTLLRYLIVAISVFMGLSSQGLEGLTTKLAIILAGLGFATADAIKDFFSYFILLVQRPVKVGDFIRVLDGLSTEETVSLTGFVRSITPRSIVIRKRNSTTVVIPNSRVVQNPVMNWTYTRGFFAFEDMFITVPYGVDPSFVRLLFLEVLDQNQNILKNPAPIVRLEGFVDNGYLFLIRGYLTSSKVADQWDIASEVRLQLVKALRDKNIEVASPVRTLRILPSQTSFLAAAETTNEEDATRG